MYQTENYTNPIKHEVPLPTEAGLFCENDKTRTMKRIAIQGIKGSYHDMAAHYFFHNEDIELICCSTFEEVFATVKDDSTILGMAAIENTIAGSLLHNYELLCDSGLTIVGEHKLRISHSLLCLPDDNLEDITEVHSHPVALMQCREFLARHPGRVMTYDAIMIHVWGPYLTDDNKILRVNMANIRRKLEKNPAEPEYIFTETGVGYRMLDGEKE